MKFVISDILKTFFDWKKQKNIDDNSYDCNTIQHSKVNLQENCIFLGTQNKTCVKKRV